MTAKLGIALLAFAILAPYRWPGQHELYEIRQPREEGPAQALEAPRPTLREALENWRQARLAAGHPADKPMPAVIVAASGGASRAAFWLLRSMEMLDASTDDAFGTYLFAISGVSGGSLGAATYLHILRSYPRTTIADGKVIVSGVDWTVVGPKLDGFQRSDLLVASISTYFASDTIRSILRVIPLVNAHELLPDRGEALERAFERHWADEDRLGVPKDLAESGLIKLWQDGYPGMPHFFLNGTDVDSGRRLITSTIRFASEDDLFPGSEDLLSLLGHDVPAATAVTNSARFPFISPAGRFRADGQPRQVVDGGYFENYGARTAAELAEKVEQISAEMVAEARKRGENMAPIVPIVVVISNDADGLRAAVQSCKGEAACRTLEEVTVSCDPPPEPMLQAALASAPPYESAAAGSPHGGGFGPEGLAPFLGLYATRAAHGQDALHILRRRYCPTVARDEAGSAAGAMQPAVAQSGGLRRMIHIALPRPNPDEGESAPLNWVLNASAIHFLSSATGIDFNRKQAESLRTTLSALLLEGAPASQQTSSN